VVVTLATRGLGRRIPYCVELTAFESAPDASKPQPGRRCCLRPAALGAGLSVRQLQHPSLVRSSPACAELALRTRRHIAAAMEYRRDSLIKTRAPLRVFARRRGARVAVVSRATKHARHRDARCSQIRPHKAAKPAHQGRCLCARCLGDTTRTHARGIDYVASLGDWNTGR